MNVAFCINQIGMIGLGATLVSLIRSCSNIKNLKFWFIYSGLTQFDRRKLTTLLQKEGIHDNIHFVEFDPDFLFSSLNSLHGDRTAYGRLLLADFIDEDQVLYLDADLVIEVDVMELERFPFEGHAIAAVEGGKFEYTLGNNFYKEKVGLSSDLLYFNAGVLLLNLKEWRQREIKERCMEIANKFKVLPSHDQSLLNIYFAGDFARLPSNFNYEWQADMKKPKLDNRMIFHFIGSPKPWDPLGNFIHSGYNIWDRYRSKEWDVSYNTYTLRKVKRIWKIRRSYLRWLYNTINI